MKAFIPVILILSLFSISYAQENITVKEETITFSKGNQPGFTVFIPQAKLKEVNSNWKKYLKQKSKSDVREINHEIVLSKSVIPEVSVDSVIIYSFCKSNISDIQLTALITGDDSVFYSSMAKPDLSTAFNTFIRNFAVNEYRNAVSDELEAEKKKLKDLEDNLNKLENDNDKNEKKIKSNEREVDRLEDEIKSNKQMTELKSDAIYKQQKVIATYLEPSDPKKEEEKKLKDLEKEKKKLEKKTESLHDDIDNNESENKSLKKKIDLNNDDVIPAKKNEIIKQKAVIVGVENKLKEIR